MAEAPLILVVDDEPDILTINRMLLEREGWQVITSGDGVDAIQKAMDRRPDAILLDVMMPRMNGYQVCRLLKSYPETAGIPIIICTVHTRESDRLYARTSGADEFLTKPFDHQKFLRVMRRLLAGHPSAPVQARPRARSLASTDTILSEVNRLLDRRLMELTILQHLTRAMAGTLHLDGVLTIVLQSLVNELGYPGGMLFLLGEEGVLEERGARGAPLRFDSRAHPVIAAALAENRVAILGVEEMPRAAPADLCARISSPAAILVPIQAKGRPIGLLVVESPSTEVERDQRDFLLTLATQAGLAIDNANLYDRTLQLSITDGLTGIFNYRHFRERLDQELARARRYGSPLGLLLIDIDRFKVFNDRYGHLLGDEVLRAVAQCIRSRTRDVDVVARYGGEEFAVILQEMAEPEIAASAERIREAVAAARIPGPDGAGLGVTVSIGAAVTTGGELPAREFLSRADQALYRAKDEGRDRVRSFAADLACP